MLRVLARRAVLIAMLTSAGCLAAGPAAESPAPAAEAAVFAYLCPGDAGSGGERPCLATLPRGEAAHHQQPFVAVHPTDPDVIAVGVTHSSLARDRAVAAATGGDVTGSRLAVYVSEDGGASWSETFAPPPPGEDPLATSSEGDASIVIDPEGTLHVAGLARVERMGEPEDPNGLRNLRAYYVRSHDLGKTWSDAVWLDGSSGHDRAWLVRDVATGTLYVVWQDGYSGLDDRTVFVAWSEDGGRSWRGQEPSQRAPCYRVGTPVAWKGGLRFACARSEDADEVVQVYAFDAASGRVSLLHERTVSPHPGQDWPSLTALADGSLALFHNECPPAADPSQTCLRDSVVLRSRDGGGTWDAVGTVMGMGGAGWERGRIYGSEADPFGGQHLLVRYERVASRPPADPLSRPTVAYEVRHVVLDAAGDVVHQRALHAWQSPVEGTDEGPLGPVVTHPHCQGTSCHYGLAWGRDRALLAFANGGEVRLAAVAHVPR